MQRIPLLVLVFLMFLPACNSKKSELHVKPGDGIGEVMLGELRADIIERLGKPLQVDGEVVADSLIRDEWQVSEESVLSVLFNGEKAIQVQFDGPGFIAPSGLSGYSSISQIREAFPELEVSVMAHDMDNMYLDEVDQGIAFSVRAGRDGEATNDDGDVIHVFVHPEGEEVIAIVHHHDEHH